MFSLAPAISTAEELAILGNEEKYVALKSDQVEIIKNQAKTTNYHPKSILKQSPLHTSITSPDNLSKQKKLSRSKLKVKINLPDNEISLANSNALMRSPVCLPSNVKAEEGNGMKPLSDLAAALGMKYVFAESWAPEYGNAILSKWPIKTWKVQKIADDKDFRNVLKATVDVPWAGEINFDCTQLDHLNEYWRMKQISAIIQSSDSPHILAGGLNSLDGSDYSLERWMDIVKMQRTSAGECEPVVIIAKGQNVQGTCKYGTRVDYILASPESPYKFVPGSYSVISSKGTSDHHIVKVDITKASESGGENVIKQQGKPKQKIVKMTNPCYARGIWKVNP
ncbi:hypothetical protein Pint_24981 [Pistacia integerrima]|uniref:Uncharacterized protein n=1 Tax=Pistacia integerrima TaxID=434235 RepID=A0ACC0YAP3_9ROSI|nr:hypothetical protein Pint_24981 [Pistacia integerrima]